MGLDRDQLVDVLGGFDPAEYEAEVAERWGQTDAYRESARRTGSYSRDDWERITAEVEAIEAGFAECLIAGESPDSAQVKDLAERHRLHIDSAYYPCSPVMQFMFTVMYIAEERFARHYDDRAPGLANYVREAILANAIDRA